MRLVVGVNEVGIVEQFLQPAGSVVLEGRQQVLLQGGEIAQALGDQAVQTERGLREEGRQKRRNFFFRSAACSCQVISSVKAA